MASRASVSHVWFSSNAANMCIISSVVIDPAVGVVEELEPAAWVLLDMMGWLVVFGEGRGV
jgi:hypothetical protein